MHTFRTNIYLIRHWKTWSGKEISYLRYPLYNFIQMCVVHYNVRDMMNVLSRGIIVSNETQHGSLKCEPNFWDSYMWLIQYLSYGSFLTVTLLYHVKNTATHKHITFEFMWRVCVIKKHLFPLYPGFLDDPASSIRLEICINNELIEVKLFVLRFCYASLLLVFFLQLCSSWMVW